MELHRSYEHRVFLVGATRAIALAAVVARWRSFADTPGTPKSAAMRFTEAARLLEEHGFPRTDKSGVLSKEDDWLVEAFEGLIDYYPLVKRVPFHDQ